MSKRVGLFSKAEQLAAIEEDMNIAVLAAFDQFAPGASSLLLEEDGPVQRVCKAIEMLSLLACANTPEAHKDLAQGLDAYYSAVAGLSDVLSSPEQYRHFLMLQTAVLGLLRSVTQERFYSQMQNTLKVNAAKAEVKQRGRDIAGAMWASDNSIRTGAMADLVYKQLIDEGKTEQLPETIETLKDWIKDLAPGRARRPGGETH